MGTPIAATDPESDAIVYSITGDASRLFNVNARTGQITVAEGALLDYESERNTFVVTITAADPAGSGETTEISVTVTIADDEIPGRVARYDDNRNEKIDLPELLAAITDYDRAQLGISDLIAIVSYYLAS